MIVTLGLCTYVNAKSPSELESIVWGGGGAFTGTSFYKGSMYLSSDVSGVWKQVDGSWVPFVQGLSNYNVTTLVVFNDLLFAITSDELLYTNGESDWTSTHISLDTYRTINDQPVAISNDEAQMCIANRNGSIVCIDTDLKHLSLTSKTKSIVGLVFHKDKPNSLLYYSKNELFLLNLDDNSNELNHAFTDDIVSIFNSDVGVLIATKAKIFKYEDMHKPIYKAYSSNIVNAFSVTDKSSIKHELYISLGSKWNITLHHLSINSSERVALSKLKVEFDKNLPHREAQTSLTKLLSVKQVDDSSYITDYWGVYKISLQAKHTLLEVTNDAHNVVATDLIIADKFIYVSTMDNGVIQIQKTSQPDELRTKQAISFDIVEGHAWSMLYFNKTLYTIFSPWNSANDLLFQFSELSGRASVKSIANYDSRPSRGAFWGNAYSRKLAYYFGIVSFRDGADGRLIVDDSSSLKIEEPYSIGEFNKVYKAIEELDGLLYVATCEHPSTVIVLNQHVDAQFTIRLPKGFCAFSSYKQGKTLYFLGSMKGRSVIYKLDGRKVSKYAEFNKGSAFYSMFVNPLDPQQIAIATISWSNKSTSSLLVSNNGGDDYIDKTCLLTHANGVAAMKFDSLNSSVFILQKVGGILNIPLAMLFSEKGCANVNKEKI